MNTSTLKEYIRNIYQLEVSLYNQQTLYTKVQSEVHRLENFKGQEMNQVWSTKGYFEIKGILGGAVFGGAIGTLVGAFTSVPFFAGTIGGIIVGVLLVLVNGLYELNRAKSDNKKISNINQKIINNNLDEQEVINEKITIINQELTIIKNSYTRTKNILAKYYEKGIVFPKYRNLLAISSIYEYLSSGRCNSLEGHEGAYNIFENEVRQNLIISKLDDVIRHLEKIESNQYMLYSAIQDSNRKTDRLLQEMDKVANNLQRIESNNQIIAYNSTIAAKNLEFLKWIEVFRA